MVIWFVEQFNYLITMSTLQTDYHHTRLSVSTHAHSLIREVTRAMQFFVVGLSLYPPPSTPLLRLFPSLLLLWIELNWSPYKWLCWSSKGLPSIHWLLLWGSSNSHYGCQGGPRPGRGCPGWLMSGEGRAARLGGPAGSSGLEGGWEGWLVIECR